MLTDLKNKILQGDARELLRQMPNESVDCCITSPPYWGLRDYGTKPLVWDGRPDCRHKWKTGKQIWHSDRGSNKRKEIFDRSFQTKGTLSDTCKKCGAWRGSLGQEPGMELYVKHLCDIFDEVKRVLKKTGTCWVNLGDTYQGSPVSGKEGGFSGRAARNNPQYAKAITIKNRPRSGLPDKCLCGIPSRFSIEMINRGWILRNEIIWHKPNAMPASVKDRFTVDFEKLFFFVKSGRYYFEQQFQPLAISTPGRYARGVKKTNKYHEQRWSGARGLCKPRSNIKHTDRSMGTGGSGIIGHSGYFQANGRPLFNPKGRNKRCVWSITTKAFSGAHFAVYPPDLIETPIKAGCPKGGLVLDPFFGSGTTAVVSRNLNRNFVGIELSLNYIKIAEKRLKTSV